MAKTALGIVCMDGRPTVGTLRFLWDNYEVEYMDMIAEPGICRQIADLHVPLLTAIEKKLLISYHEHGARLLAISAHEDCAGNRVSKDKDEDKKAQVEHLRKAAGVLFRILRRLGLNDMEVVLLWSESPWQEAKRIPLEA